MVAKAMSPSVDLYTDGACRGNPGPGGYGVVLLSGSARKELSQGYRRTTNNRMELMAVIAGLRALKKPCELTIYSDSKYLVDAMTKNWLRGWKRRGWLTSSKTPVLNRDLWEALEAKLAEHRARFVWVKGHASNKENNRCDELAVAAARAHGNRADDGYELAAGG